ncbi:hypothetical protein NDU88_006308 [Pleurodeles waltl]|uniref:Uncharacterized protein n=1 Tax=Pleurodeles waltl TaxID=8319 RepID=A0AAV7VR12_PLEWA|nr:hypothetical protein NDU88_006308 [Pleurodeles waltl]
MTTSRTHRRLPSERVTWARGESRQLTASRGFEARAANAGMRQLRVDYCRPLIVESHNARRLHLHGITDDSFFEL